MEQEIINYIKEARKHGLGDDVIKQNLLNAGWEAAAVEENFVHEKAMEVQSKIPVGQQEAIQNVVKPTVSQPTPVAQAQPVKMHKGAKLALMIAAVVIVLTACGYAYYTFGYNNSTKVWQKFTQSPQSTIYQSDIKFSYSDPNSLNASASPISLKDLKLDFNGSFYANTSDLKNPQSDSNVQYTFANGNTNFSTGFQYVLLNNVLYVNIGDNPLLSLLKGSMANGQDVQWIKVDLGQLENASSSPSTAGVQELKNIFNADFTNQLQKIWTNANVVTVSKFDGTESISGVRTLHFDNKVDKQALKNAFGQMLTTIVGAFNKQGASIPDQNVKDTQFAVNAIIDKIQVQDMQTWIGATDFKLYKVHFVSNAPSVISAIQMAADNPQISLGADKSRDAKRLADVRQMASALELYFNDNNGYPEATNAGTPVGLTPVYIGLLPTAPTPADGTCTDYYNGYWYSPSGTKSVQNGKTVHSSYSLTFCLGAGTGGYEAGIAELSPTGIEANISCPGTIKSLCAKEPSQVVQPASNKDVITKVINAIQFNGLVNIDATYHDYGKTKQLTVPEGAYDIMQSFNKQFYQMP